MAFFSLVTLFTTPTHVPGIGFRSKTHSEIRVACIYSFLFFLAVVVVGVDDENLQEGFTRGGGGFYHFFETTIWRAQPCAPKTIRVT